MKKVLVLVIAFMVIGLAVVPQVQAQSASDLAEIQRLTDEFLAGRLSMEEFERRTQALLSGIENQAQQEPQQQQQQQGANAGWPSNSIFAKYGLSQLRQPAGTTARYTDGADGQRECTIWITGGNSTILQDLKRQIENATGERMYENSSTFFGLIVNNSASRAISSSTRLQIGLELDNNVIIITFSLFRAT